MLLVLSNIDIETHNSSVLYLLHFSIRFLIDGSWLDIVWVLKINKNFLQWIGILICQYEQKCYYFRFILVFQIHHLQNHCSIFLNQCLKSLFYSFRCLLDWAIRYVLPSIKRLIGRKSKVFYKKCLSSFLKLTFNFVIRLEIICVRSVFRQIDFVLKANRSMFDQKLMRPFDRESYEATAPPVDVLTPKLCQLTFVHTKAKGSH